MDVLDRETPTKVLPGKEAERFIQAVKLGNTDAINEIIDSATEEEKKTFLNLKIEGEPLILYSLRKAITTKDTKVFDILKYAGANINATNTYLQGALHIAAQYSNEDLTLANELMESGVKANPDICKRSPSELAYLRAKKISESIMRLRGRKESQETEEEIANKSMQHRQIVALAEILASYEKSGNRVSYPANHLRQKETRGNQTFYSNQRRGHNKTIG